MKNNLKKTVVDYQRLLDEKIKEITKNSITPKLLIHSCCAPCSSYVLEYLSQYFSITVFFYNPNIHPEKEYNKRLAEQKRLISLLPARNRIDFIKNSYEPEIFFEKVKRLENEREGGRRCLKCYSLRLEKTAQKSLELDIPYFTTTLTVSPHKDAHVINILGKNTAKKYQLNYLYSDFKKRNGFQRSIILSEKYTLYRQNYCGCIYSKGKMKI